MLHIASGLLLTTNLIDSSHAEYFGLNYSMTLKYHMQFLLLSTLDPRMKVLTYSVSSTAHIILHKRNATVCCPTR